jgi:hypothetical protein
VGRTPAPGKHKADSHQRYQVRQQQDVGRLQRFRLRLADSRVRGLLDPSDTTPAVSVALPVVERDFATSTLIGEYISCPFPLGSLLHLPMHPHSPGGAAVSVGGATPMLSGCRHSASALPHNVAEGLVDRRRGSVVELNAGSGRIVVDLLGPTRADDCRGDVALS